MMRDYRSLRMMRCDNSLRPRGSTSSSPGLLLISEVIVFLYYIFKTTVLFIASSVISNRPGFYRVIRLS